MSQVRRNCGGKRRGICLGIRHVSRPFAEHFNKVGIESFESDYGRAQGKVALEVISYCIGVVDTCKILGYLVDYYTEHCK